MAYHRPRLRLRLLHAISFWCTWQKLRPAAHRLHCTHRLHRRLNQPPWLSAAVQTFSLTEQNGTHFHTRHRHIHLLLASAGCPADDLAN